MTDHEPHSIPPALTGVIKRTRAAVLTVMTVLSAAALGLPFSISALAQSAPGTDIWVMDLSESGGEVHVGDPVRITDVIAL